MPVWIRHFNHRIACRKQLLSTCYLPDIGSSLKCMGMTTIGDEHYSTGDIYIGRFCYLGEGARPMSYPFAEPSEVKEKTKGNDKVTKEQLLTLVKHIRNSSPCMLVKHEMM